MANYKRAITAIPGVLLVCCLLIVSLSVPVTAAIKPEPPPARNASSVVNPGVITMFATGVTFRGGVLNGNLNDMGTATSVLVSFQYGKTTDYGETTTTQELTAPGSFSVTLSNLSPDTAYHFRAKADGGAHGTTYGADDIFTTDVAIPPEVTTLKVQNVTDTTASLFGNLNDTGTYGSPTVYFEYGLTTSYGNKTDTKIQNQAGLNGGFSFDITDLTPGTTYHFRAVADSGVYGIDNGEDMTFMTAGSSPVLIPPGLFSGDATYITTTGAVLNANLATLGNALFANVYFEYGLTSTYGSVTPTKQIVTPGSFDITVNQLTPGTEYHFRPVADSPTGKVIGADNTFTTVALPGGQSQVSAMGTLDAVAVTANSATLKGYLSSVSEGVQVAVFFEYGPDTSYGSSTPTQNMTSPGAFTATITNLKPETTYHFRANGSGVTPGNDMTFMTAAASATSTPVTTTSPASSQAVSTTAVTSSQPATTTEITPVPVTATSGVNNWGVNIAIIGAVVLVIAGVFLLLRKKPG